MNAIKNELLQKNFFTSYDQTEEICSPGVQNWKQEKRNAQNLRIALIALAAGLYGASIVSTAMVGSVFGMQDTDLFTKTFLIGGAMAIFSSGAIAKIVQHKTGIRECYAGLIGATTTGAVIGCITQDAEAGWISGTLLNALALTYTSIRPNMKKRAYEVVE